jgi:putative membrane protein
MWVQRLRATGTDPDPRFSFANERTFLAWIRTSLALMAAGVGVEAFATDLSPWGRQALASLLVVLAGLLAAGAFRRWLRSEEALRSALPLPPHQLAPIIGYGLSLSAVLALVMIVVD